MAATHSPLATDLYITLDKRAREAWWAPWIWENKLGWPSNWRYFGPRTSLSCTLLLCPYDPLSRVCDWLTAVDWVLMGNSCLTTPSPPPPTPPCHMIKGIPRGTQKQGWGYCRQEESETITTARTVCVCVCMCMLIDSLILSYNSNSNQVTHLFLLSCEVLMSPYDLKAWTISSNPFVEDLFLEIASELV